jgi:transposase-like protein
MICVDGGAGLLAALPMIFPGIAVQRCWAHYAALRIMPTSAAKPAWEALIAVRGAA